MHVPGLPGVTIKAFFKRLYCDIVDDAVPDSAAQLAYYFLFSLFPLLFFLVSLAAYLPIVDLVESVLDRARYLMPESALVVVQDQLDALLLETRPRLLTLGVLITVWTASRGVDALRKALNLAYGVPETRPFWKTQGLAILMTFFGATLTLTAFAMFLAGSDLGGALAERLDLARQFHAVWSWLRWPLTAVVVMLNGALSYYLLPDVKQQWRFITPGSVAATFLWIGATWLFTWYVEQFGRFNVTYGSIGGVVVLMIWLYLSGLILILGGELNSVVEHLSVRGKEPGAHEVGEVPETTPEGRPLPITPGAAKRVGATSRLKEKLRQLRRDPSGL